MSVILQGMLDYTLELPAKASEAIKPGMLLQVDTGEFAKHSTSGGNAVGPIFAAENATQASSDAIADGDIVVGLVNPQKVKATLAASQTIVVGDMLESNGDGHLIKHTPGDEATTILHLRVVGMALEAVTTGLGETKPITVGRVR